MQASASSCNFSDDAWLRFLVEGKWCFEVLTTDEHGQTRMKMEHREATKMSLFLPEIFPRGFGRIWSSLVESRSNLVELARVEKSHELRLAGG